MARFERKYRVMFRKALVRQGAIISEQLGKGIYNADYLSSLIIQEPIEQVYKALYYEAVRYYGEREYKRLRTQERKFVADIWFTAAMSFIADTGATRIVSITEASRAFVRTTVNTITQQAVEEGWGAAKTANHIQAQFSKEWNEQAFYRAERIARTEVGAAANYGQYQGATATGRTDLQKRWLASLDGRERESHREAHGKVIKMNDSFDVGGARMMYPCDPAGGAQEVINCRCVMQSITPLSEYYNHELT